MNEVHAFIREDEVDKMISEAKARGYAKALEEAAAKEKTGPYAILKTGEEDGVPYVDITLDGKGLVEALFAIKALSLLPPGWDYASPGTAFTADPADLVRRLQKAVSIASDALAPKHKSE